MRDMTIVADLEKFLAKNLADFAQKVEATMRENAPVYNGKLIASIKTTKVNAFHYQVGPHTDHDWWAENGNDQGGAYIEPKNASVLVWYDQHGGKHASKYVSTYSAERYGDGRTPRKGHYAKNTVDKYNGR